MSKTSPIPNKRPITLSVDANLAENAKKKGINISLILDAALNKELNSYSNDAFLRAVEKQNETMKKFIEETGQEENYDNWKYGGAKNVLEKKEQGRREVDLRQAITNIKDS